MTAADPQHLIDDLAQHGRRRLAVRAVLQDQERKAMRLCYEIACLVLSDPIIAKVIRAAYAKLGLNMRGAARDSIRQLVACFMRPSTDEEVRAVKEMASRIRAAVTLKADVQMFLQTLPDADPIPKKAKPRPSISQLFDLQAEMAQSLAVQLRGPDSAGER